MAITVDGNSLIIEGTITIDNAFDPTTGVATMTITPAGGIGTLPGLIPGPSGMPAEFRNVNVETSPTGLPTASLTEISPGGPGESSVWDLNLGLVDGPMGAIESFLLTGASDVADTITGLGHDALLMWDAASQVFNPAPVYVPVYAWPTSINNIVTNATGPQQLCSMTIPPQSFDWYPIVAGYAMVSGTSATQVKLSANLTSTAGIPVGSGNSGPGVSGQVVLTAAGIGPPPVVSANSSATIVISAQQVAATSDTYQINGNDCAFSLTAQPTLT